MRRAASSGFRSDFKRRLLPRRPPRAERQGTWISRSLRYGMARGVFSNEAGLGTLAVLHGEAKDTTPQQQGMWAMFEVFFDTVILCTLTALVILCMTGSAPERVPYEGAALASWCFEGRLGAAGEFLVSAFHGGIRLCHPDRLVLPGKAGRGLHGRRAGVRPAAEAEIRE